MSILFKQQTAHEYRLLICYMHNRRSMSHVQRLPTTAIYTTITYLCTNYYDYLSLY
jgi:hypothetical protein